MKYNTIILDKDEGVATNMPEVLNAVNQELRDELLGALDNMETDDEIKVVIVTGAGRAFCAGADISTFDKQSDGIREYMAKILKWEPQRILACEKPIIGAVNGVAAGQGAEWLLQFDLIVASDKARIAFPEVLGDVTISLFCLPGKAST